MLGNITMISPKLAMYTAVMAAASVGAFAIPAMAQPINVDQDIDRNNEISQFIAQSNEACTNTVVAAQDDSDDQYVKAHQSNDCYVEQSNDAEQEAEIDDESENLLVNFAGFFD